MTTLYCFSGSGNTKRAANLLVQELQPAEICTYKSIEEHPKSERVGFLFPVYYSVLPRMVDRFLQNFPFQKGVSYFAISTYGGFAGNALHVVRDILKEHGVMLCYANSIATVANYIALYNPKLSSAHKKLVRADQKTMQIAKDLATCDLTKEAGLGIRLPFIEKKDRMPKPDEDLAFVCNRSACIGCGLCAKVCPASNIVLEKGHPVWQHHCEHCMACIHWCPKQTIDYGLRTVGRNRYHHPEVDAQELSQ